MCFGGGGSSAQSIYDEKDKSDLEKPLPSLSMTGERGRTSSNKEKKKTSKKKRRNLLNPYGSEGFDMDAQGTGPSPPSPGPPTPGPPSPGSIY